MPELTIHDIVSIVSLHALLSNRNVTADFDECVRCSIQVADEFISQKKDVVTVQNKNSVAE
jgi:hypothetical protein